MNELAYHLGKMKINRNHTWHRFSETNGALCYASSDRVLDLCDLPEDECLLIQTRDIETMLVDALS